MSYCRFSDGDIYAYPTNDGITVIVAKNRFEGGRWGPSCLPYAGERREDVTAEEAIEWLTELRELGYDFPDDVCDSIKEDPL